MNITVYCGAATGNDPAYLQAAQELGEWIGRNGHTLVWGGGGTGLMGAVANAALAAGAPAIGVIPDFLLELETPPAGFTNYQVTTTMAERRTRMIELADAFVALPGGPGTLEELSEVMALIKLRRCAKPLILANINGYYEPLAATYQTMVDHGFIPAEILSHLQLASSIQDLTKLLSE
ncbi:MAG: TIGR00730 family Rossman fold protein [Coriobacteriia bacterium]|nr:TIGR00730 family Rossman fold protein [Coriobacteriia bacterium]